jgi:hypothetical protein
LDNIRQQERIEIIAEELVTMKPKIKIIEEYAIKWQCDKSTVRAIVDEAMWWMLERDKTDREQMRTLNAGRLDYLLGEARSIRDKSKVIDLLNRIYGLYETNINLGSQPDTEIKFSFGGDQEQCETNEVAEGDD